MEEALRLRLKFEDPSILSKSQRLNGFKRSWILVEPHLRTISDVASHLLRTFHLSASCPNDILLSMDGFVLPHFETTAILKDEDLVCVKRIRSKLLKVTEECGLKKGVVEQNFVEKLPLVPDVPLLANEEFEKGSRGCQSGTEEDEDKLHQEFVHEDSTPNGDVSIKKRKASKPLKNSKRKRHCENTDNSTQKEHDGNSLQNGDCQKKSSMSNRDQEHKPEDAGKDVSDAKCTTNAVLSGLIKNQEGTITPSCLPDGTEQVSVIRSTTRKKAKRRWLRSQRLAEKEQIIQKHIQQAEDLNADEACKDQNHDAKDPPNILNEDGEPGDDIVPVVVRPGHIRFAASGKEKEVQQYEEEGSFNWQGITNKKKGQKWGMDKQSSSKRHENKSPYRKELGSEENMDTSHQETHSVCTWDNYTSPEERRSGSKLNHRSTPSRNCATQHKQPANASMDYKKLVPLTDIPVQGDTIAYRLLELSSSFCPEMTSYRVGKVSRFDLESNRVMLVPVPEYSFEFKKAVDDASEELPDTSNYNEDGSLEIDYTSLVDVRIVKRSSDLHPGTSLHHVANGTPPSRLNPTSSGSSWRNETPVRSKAPPSHELTTTNNWTGLNTSPAPASENGNKDVWEEISAALSTKKAELLKEDNWNKKTKPANGPRSYRAMRSSALGPTMARLRAQNVAQTN